MYDPKLINPNMMRQGINNLENMSDADLERMSKTMGFGGGLDPKLLRMASQQMKGMSDNDINNLKNNMPPLNNMNPNFQRSNSATTQPTYQPSSQPSQPTQSSQQNTNNHVPRGASNTTSSNTTTSSNKSSTINFVNDNCFTKLEKIKNKGNDFFKEKKYSEANEKYYEVLNEIEYINSDELAKFKNEINNLELTTRLNLANAKLKTGDYNLAAHECLKVLKSGDNFKAHYRAGLAYYNLKNYEKSSSHFLKAREVGKGEEEQAINNYLNEMKPHLKKENSVKVEPKKEVQQEPIKEKEVEEKPSRINYYDTSDKNDTEKNEEKVKEEEEVEKVIEEKPSKINYFNDNNKNDEKETKNDEKVNIEKNVEKEIKFNNLDKKQEEKQDNKKSYDDEIKIDPIEEKLKPKIEKNIPSNNTNYNTSNTTNYNPYSGTSNIYDKAPEIMKNLDDNQINSMTNMFRNMDNNTIRQMMKSTRGLDVTDDQILMMKAQSTPDKVKNAINIQKANSSSNNSSNNTNTITPNNNATPNVNPNMFGQNMQTPKLDDEQLKMTSNMMSTMDNDTIKNLMKSSGMGMDLNDSQIEMMKNMFKNPDAIKNCMNSINNNPQNINNQTNNMNSMNNTTNMQNMNTNQEALNTTNTSVNPNPSPGGMDFSKMSELMSKNPDLMKMAMHSMGGMCGNKEGGMPNPGNMDFSQISDMMSKNPELMKMAMSSMGMGGVEGADPNMMMNSMQTILWLMSIPSRIKNFFKSTRGILFSLIIVILFISYYYG